MTCFTGCYQDILYTWPYLRLVEGRDVLEADWGAGSACRVRCPGEPWGVVERLVPGVRDHSTDRVSVVAADLRTRGGRGGGGAPAAPREPGPHPAREGGGGASGASAEARRGRARGSG